jgi:NAD(P)-dependent dehydrogenase (short-subunit alcohol dehydrogenase family)
MRQVLLVLGATGSVGRAVVRSAVAAGVPVVGAARRLEALRAVEHENESGLLETAFASLKSEVHARRLVQNLHKRRIEPAAVIVALRGGDDAGCVQDMGSNQFARMLARDLAPHIVAARTLLPVLARNGGRYIVVGTNEGRARPPGSGYRAVLTAALETTLRILQDDPRHAGSRLEFLPLPRADAVISSWSEGAYNLYLSAVGDLAVATALDPALPPARPEYAIFQAVEEQLSRTSPLPVDSVQSSPDKTPRMSRLDLERARALLRSMLPEEPDGKPSWDAAN